MTDLNHDARISDLEENGGGGGGSQNGICLQKQTGKIQDFGHRKFPSKGNSQYIVIIFFCFRYDCLPFCVNLLFNDPSFVCSRVQ